MSQLTTSILDDDNSKLIRGILCPYCNKLIPINYIDQEFEEHTSKSSETRYTFDIQTEEFVPIHETEMIFDQHVIHINCTSMNQIIYNGELQDLFVIYSPSRFEIIHLGRYWREKFNDDNLSEGDIVNFLNACHLNFML